MVMAQILQLSSDRSHKTISMCMWGVQGSGGAEELEKLFGGWLAGSVQV